MTDLQISADDVRSAYRLLLGRDADEAGFQHHLAHARQYNHSPVDLARTLMRSDEFRLREAQRPSVQEIQLHGVRLFPWAGDKLIGDGVVSSGTYEPHVLPLFLQILEPGNVVLDVGANIGIFSLTAASRVGPDGKVIAVEPVHLNVQSLCKGVHANGFRNVAILPVAASDCASVVGVMRNSDSSNGIVDATVTGSTSTDFVPTQRLDTLLSHLDRLDVIKIDIEGHEPLAWPGMRSLVERHRPIIFSEFSPAAIRNHSRTEPEAYLAELFGVAVGSIRVLHGDGSSAECATPSAIMDQWRRANPRMQRPAEGTIHLDLVIRTRPR